MILIQVISGHEGPVSCLAFNPSPASGASQLATASWDKTLKIWDALSASSSTTETIEVHTLSIYLFCIFEMSFLSYKNSILVPMKRSKSQLCKILSLELSIINGYENDGR